MKDFLKKNKMTLLSITILIIWAAKELIFCYKEGLTCSDPIILYYHINSDLDFFYIQILAPLFVFIPAIWNFHKELNTGFIKNQLTRIEYKKYMVKHYLRALSKSLILPLFVIFFFLMCCFLTGGFAIGTGTEYYGWLASPDPVFLDNLVPFMIVYVVNMFFHSVLYVNLGLLYCKKYSNIVINIILSYLSFIILDIIMEVFLGNLLLARILNIHNVTYSLSLFNIWTYVGITNLPFTVIYSVMLAVISSIIILCKYKDKENVLIESEK